MKLRDATPQDAKALGAILSEFVATTDWLPELHTPEENRGFCLAMIERGWVRLVEGAEIIGFIARDDAEVNTLYVGAAHRGQGAGTALLKEAQAARDDLTLWTFQDNLGARRFYAAHGFVETKRTDGAGNDERLPDVQLEWRRP